jgi:general secretion pathway protein G
MGAAPREVYLCTTVNAGTATEFAAPNSAARAIVGLKMVHRSYAPQAFSLMELIAVVTILGVVAALVLPRVISGTDVAKEKACFHNRAEIGITVERYYMHTDAWPANDLADIGANPNYFPDGLPTCPVSGQPYRVDPVTHRVVGHATSGDHDP